MSLGITWRSDLNNMTPMRDWEQQGPWWILRSTEWYGMGGAVGGHKTKHELIGRKRR